MSEQTVDDRRVGGFERSAATRARPRPRAALPLGRRRGLGVCRGCPHGLLLLVGSTASDGPCAARSVWVRRRAAMTRSDGVDGRLIMRNAFEPVVPANPATSGKPGGSTATHCECSMTRGILRIVVGGETPNSTAPRGTRRRQELNSNLTPC